MIEGVLYSITTGEIEANVRVQDELVGMVAGPGQGFLEAPPDVTYLTHYVSGGMLVAYNAAQRFTKANRPPYTVEWSNTLMVWVDQRTLQEARQQKVAQLLAVKAQAFAAGFYWRGFIIPHSREQEGQILTVDAFVRENMALPPNWQGYWEDETGAPVPLVSVADWLDFMQARQQRGLEIFRLAAFYQAQLLAATTNAEIDAITVPLEQIRPSAPEVGAPPPPAPQGKVLAGAPTRIKAGQSAVIPEGVQVLFTEPIDMLAGAELSFDEGAVLTEVR